MPRHAFFAGRSEIAPYLLVARASANGLDGSPSQTPTLMALQRQLGRYSLGLREIVNAGAK